MRLRDLILWILLLLRALTSSLSAQSADRRLTLDEAILLARTQSADAAVVINEFKTAYWEYRTFQADLLPEFTFTGTLPNYSKQYSAYQQSNGAYTFVRSNVLEMTGALGVTQNIWPTGGKLSLNTSLDYLQQLGADGDKRFMAIPVELKLTQPIFSVNPIRWKRKIEPVRYREAKANFITATEEVAMKTISAFFSLILARENVTIARQNHDNAVRLYDLAVAKRRIGQISESDLMQLRISMLDAESTLTSNETNCNSALFTLRSFLGMSETDRIDPLLPPDPDRLPVEYAAVLDKAQANHAFSLNIRRRQLEADYAVATAKGEMRQISLFASVGLSGEDAAFRRAYGNPHDNQVVQVGVTLPLIDWGKRKGKVKVAESNREMMAAKLRQEEMNFSQDLFILVEQFNNQAKQLRLAAEVDELASRRYNTALETFVVGSLSILELNDARNSKDSARRQRINQLYLYWYYYYQLRSLTLWDFELACPIDDPLLSDLL